MHSHMEKMFKKGFEVEYKINSATDKSSPSNFETSSVAISCFDVLMSHSTPKPYVDWLSS